MLPSSAHLKLGRVGVFAKRLQGLAQGDGGLRKALWQQHRGGIHAAYAPQGMQGIPSTVIDAGLSSSDPVEASSHPPRCQGTARPRPLPRSAEFRAGGRVSDRAADDELQGALPQHDRQERDGESRALSHVGRRSYRLLGDRRHRLDRRHAGFHPLVLRRAQHTGRTAQLPVPQFRAGAKRGARLRLRVAARLRLSAVRRCRHGAGGRGPRFPNEADGAELQPAAAVRHHLLEYAPGASQRRRALSRRHARIHRRSRRRKQLHGVWYKDHASGSNRVDKFERDIRLLEEAP